MPTYVELQEQIKELQKQAEEAKKQELEGVIKELKEKISLYDITAKDLGFSELPAKEKKSKPTESKEPLPPKYRSPDGSNEWSGRGRKPQWFEELIELGWSEADLLIDNQ